MSGTARAYHHAASKAAKLATMRAWDSIALHAVANGCWPRQAESLDNVVSLAPVRAS